MLRLFTVQKLLKNSSQNYLKIALKNASVSAAGVKTSADRRYMLIDVNKSEKPAATEQLKYPLIWLRDNCQCSSCFNALAKSRTINWAKFDIKSANPKSITVGYTNKNHWVRFIEMNLNCFN